MIPMCTISTPKKTSWGRHRYLLFILLPFALFSSGCSSVFLRKAAPSVKLTGKLPGFQLSNRHQLLGAIEKQLDLFSKKSLSPKLRQFNDQIISQELLLKSLLRFQELINTCSSDEDLRSILAKEFDIYKSTAGQRGQVLFTGYYTPLYKASRVREGEFQYPLYRLCRRIIVFSIYRLFEKIGRIPPLPSTLTIMAQCACRLRAVRLKKTRSMPGRILRWPG